MVKGKNRKKDIDKVWVKTQTFIYYEKHNIICKIEGVDYFMKMTNYKYIAKENEVDVDIETFINRIFHLHILGIPKIDKVGNIIELTFYHHDGTVNEKIIINLNNLNENEEKIINKYVNSYLTI